jgi:hypothetical protein
MSLPEGLDSYDPPAASHDVLISEAATCSDRDIWGEARRIIERYQAADEVDDSVARWQTAPRVLTRSRRSILRHGNLGDDNLSMPGRDIG